MDKDDFMCTNQTKDHSCRLAVPESESHFYLHLIALSHLMTPPFEAADQTDGRLNQDLALTFCICWLSALSPDYAMAVHVVF